MNIEKLSAQLCHKYSEMQNIRRHLHQYPELSFYEQNTANFIWDYYESLPVEREKFKGNYGIKITIDSGKPGKTIALRADFDALPINEETNLPFTSAYPGVMHACGHDAHTAYMLVLASVLAENKDELIGKVVILHQPAEEIPPGGASTMIKEGCLSHVDHVLGLHLWSTIELGEIHYTYGPTMTGRSTFTLTVKGKSGHGSSPHLAHDAIVGASYLVIALQTLTSRMVNPSDLVVLTIGHFDGTGIPNIIQDKVELKGEVRYLNSEMCQTVQSHVLKLARGIAETYSLEIDVNYLPDYPVLVNDHATTEKVIKELSSSKVATVHEVKANTASEDFAYYAQERPSTYLFVGAKPKSGLAYPHHHPKFDIEEESMLIAAKTMLIALSSLLSDTI